MALDFSAFDGASAVFAAERGDFGPLAERLRSGVSLDACEREFLAEYLVNQTSLDVRLPGREKRREEALLIAQFVIARVVAEGGPKHAAIHEAAEMFGCSERKVEQAVADAKRDPRYAGLKKVAEAIGKGFTDARLPQNSKS